MSYEGIAEQLAGQLPVITMSGVTVRYTDAMFPQRGRRIRRSAPRARQNYYSRNRYSLSNKYSKYSPF